MATDNPNPRNVALVAEVKERLENADAVIATEYRGLNVPQQAELRSKIRAAGGELKIYKNTLVRRAADEVGMDIGEHLTGPTALALASPTEDKASDAAALAKALQEFADDNEQLIIKGGVMDGAPITSDNVKALSKIPPRDVLLSQIAGAIAAPMVKFASLLKAPLQEFASLVKALEEKGGGAEASAAAPAEAAADDAPKSEEAPAASDESEEAPASDEAPAEESAPTEEDAAPEADAPVAEADAGSEEEE